MRTQASPGSSLSTQGRVHQDGGQDMTGEDHVSVQVLPLKALMEREDVGKCVPRPSKFPPHPSKTILNDPSFLKLS